MQKSEIGRKSVHILLKKRSNITNQSYLIATYVDFVEDNEIEKVWNVTPFEIRSFK